jgi:hypothetical protein
MFFQYQEAIFWDESRASQESDGPMVFWAKMVPINSSIRFHDAQNNLNDILFTHVKFDRQWLLKLFEMIRILSGYKIKLSENLEEHRQEIVWVEYEFKNFSNHFDQNLKL